MKIKYFIGLLSLIFLATPSLNAEEKSLVGFDIGIKGYYSSGVSSSNFYYKPFADAIFYLPVVEIKPGFARYQHYQLTDGIGNYYYAGINQPGCSFSIDATDDLNIDAGYKYSFGDYDYSGHDYFADVSYDFEVITVSAGFEGTKNKYKVNSIEIDTNGYVLSAGIEYSISDSLSIDGGYDYSTIYFKNLDYSYTTNIFRLGILPQISKGLFIMCGISGGFDNADYIITGADVGISLKLFNMVKLSISYMGNYYIAPSSDTSTTTSSKKSGSGSGSGSGKSNPFLKSSEVGKSYFSHNISFGTTLVF